MDGAGGISSSGSLGSAVTPATAAISANPKMLPGMARLLRYREDHGLAEWSLEAEEARCLEPHFKKLDALLEQDIREKGGSRLAWTCSLHLLRMWAISRFQENVLPMVGSEPDGGNICAVLNTCTSAHRRHVEKDPDFLSSLLGPEKFAEFRRQRETSKEAEMNLRFPGAVRRHTSRKQVCEAALAAHAFTDDRFWHAIVKKKWILPNQSRNMGVKETRSTRALRRRLLRLEENLHNCYQDDVKQGEQEGLSTPALENSEEQVLDLSLGNLKVRRILPAVSRLFKEDRGQEFSDEWACFLADLRLREYLREKVEELAVQAENDSYGPTPMQTEDDVLSVLLPASRARELWHRVILPFLDPWARCARCGDDETNRGRNLSKCTQCGVRYCGAACQKAHWKSHKPWCRGTQETKARKIGERDVDADTVKNMDSDRLHRLLEQFRIAFPSFPDSGGEFARDLLTDPPNPAEMRAQAYESWTVSCADFIEDLVRGACLEIQQDDGSLASCTFSMNEDLAVLTAQLREQAHRYEMREVKQIRRNHCDVKVVLVMSDDSSVFFMFKDADVSSRFAAAMTFFRDRVRAV